MKSIMSCFGIGRFIFSGDAFYEIDQVFIDEKHLEKAILISSFWKKNNAVIRANIIGNGACEMVE